MNAGLSPLWPALAPECVLLVGALLILGVDLSGLRQQPVERRRSVALALAGLAVLTALLVALAVWGKGASTSGMIRLDRLAEATRLGLLGLLLLCLGVVGGARPQRHAAEYVALFLLAGLGLSLMASSQHLLVSYLVLELASLGLYVVAGFDKRSAVSAEAGLKYFLSGGLAAAFLLFGLSLLYGLTGSLQLDAMALGLHSAAPSPLLLLALVMVVVALGFKVAGAPFHFWGPDTYEGAPTSSVTLIGSAAKLAGVIFFARLLWPALGQAAGELHWSAWRTGWLPAVAVVALASLVLGNVGALAQTNVKRLLAYSAIAHAGGVLLAVMVAGPAGPVPLFYYALTYGIAHVGAFGVLAVLERAGVGPELSDLRGLWQRSPLLAGCLFVSLLSLAGVPPLAGFFGKFMVYGQALAHDGLHSLLGWLALIAIAFSVVSLYYYLKILRPALIGEAPGKTETLAVPAPAAVALVLASASLVALGCFPQWILGLFGTP